MTPEPRRVFFSFTSSGPMRAASQAAVLIEITTARRMPRCDQRSGALRHQPIPAQSSVLVDLQRIRSISMGRTLWAGAAALLVMSGVAPGSPLPVRNSSFEAPRVADDSRSNSITDWTVDYQLGAGTVRVFNPQNAQYHGATDPNPTTEGPLPAPAAGGQVAAFDFSSLPANQSASELSQSILNPAGAAVLVQKYTLYTLTVAAGRRLDQAPMNYGLSFQPTGNGLGVVYNVFDGTQLTAGTFSDHSLSWFPGRLQIGQALRIGISGGGGTISGIFSVDLDNVRLDAKPVLPGDTNLDGQVNFTDLLTLAQNYGHGGADWAHGDFTYDGLVNFSDLLLLAQNYGAPAPQAAAVPEASVRWLIRLMAAALIARHPRRAQGAANSARNSSGIDLGRPVAVSMKTHSV